MSSEDNKTTIYIGIGIIILLLLLSGGFFIMNSKNKKNLEAEKLKSESQLSEKLVVEKELAKLKADMDACRLKSEETAKKLAEAEASVAEKDKRIAYLSSQYRTLTNNNKELEELRKARAELDNLYAALKADYEKMSALNRDLQNSVASLEAQKNDLTKKLEQIELYETDNFNIYGSRGKTTEKLTFRAFWTKKLNLNFEVPQSLTDAISFRITTPAGTTVTPDNTALRWEVITDLRSFTASLSPFTGEFEASRQVVMTYAPKEKFAKGEYKIQILCNNINIGNCRVKLK